MKILVFHAAGAYQYRAVDRFLSEIEKGFRELGHEILTVDVKAQDYVAQTQQQFAKEPSFVFSFNGAGHLLQIEGKSLFDVLRTPFFNFLLDHPAHQFSKLDGTIENEVLSCVERSHVDFLDSFFEGKKSAFFIPHGGTLHEQQNDGDRPIDFLFAGSGKNHETILNGIRAFPPPLARIVDGAIDLLKASPATPPHEAIEQASRAEHMAPPALYRQVPLTMVVESYLRNLWRYETLDALDRAGVAVQIYGDGWDFAHFDNHVLNPPVDYDQSLELITQAKVALNVSPQFFSGSHERVLDAALNGAACLTSRSSFLAEVFDSGSEMAFYDVSEPSSVVEQARSLLDDDSRRGDMAQAAKLIAGRKHTWQVRAEQVVDVYRAHDQMQDILAKLKSGVDI